MEAITSPDAMTSVRPKPPAVKRIRTEGERIVKLRNVPRIVIEVTTKTPGITIKGRNVPCDIAEGGERLLTTSRIEIYQDELGEVIRDRLRKPEHYDAWERAVAMNDQIRNQWIEGESRAMRGMTPEERGRHISRHFNGGAAMYLPILGYKTGIPNILSIKLVSQSDEYRTVTLDEYQQLSDEERAEFIGTPPATPENSIDRAARVLAEVMKAATGKPARK